MWVGITWLAHATHILACKGRRHALATRVDVASFGVRIPLPFFVVLEMTQQRLSGEVVCVNE